MRFDCAFVRPTTDERRSITVDLTDGEVLSAQAAGANADLTARAFALRRAYARVPQGFLHDVNAITLVPVH
jgi:hypothetical protein